MNIDIYEASEGGYMYDIFEDKDSDKPIDGGYCSGCYFNALEMASNRVKEIVMERDEQEHSDKLDRVKEEIIDVLGSCSDKTVKRFAFNWIGAEWLLDIVIDSVREYDDLQILREELEFLKALRRR